MSTTFSVIVEDFEQELVSLQELVDVGQDKERSAKTRVATIHATTLLLAASFEEFIRQMAREYAKQVVSRANATSDLPKAMLEAAWRRTLEHFAKRRPETPLNVDGYRKLAREARPKIDSLFLFLDGDTSQDIFDHLVQNENNMRINVINSLFKVGGKSDVCAELCRHAALREFFSLDDAGRAHGELCDSIERFIKRRNEIAHSLNSAVSAGPQDILREIEMFRAFSSDLEKTLIDSAA